ncbi:hypothetical protein NL676_010210 [Syzygium grande]|nr:hypothetical protein NL676_010210 [Syzygium grande]
MHSRYESGLKPEAHCQGGLVGQQLFARQISPANRFLVREKPSRRVRGPCRVELNLSRAHINPSLILRIGLWWVRAMKEEKKTVELLLDLKT